MPVLRRGALLAALLLAGCDAGALSVPTTAEPRPVATLTQVAAHRCGERCELVVLQVTVENRGRELLCVPSVYDSESADGALVFRYDGTGELETTAAPYDPNRFLSRDYREAMRDFTTLPQHVVQPGATLKLNISLFQKFELARRPAAATLRFMSFRCADAARANAELFIDDLTGRVAFEG